MPPKKTTTRKTKTSDVEVPVVPVVPVPVVEVVPEVEQKASDVEDVLEDLTEIVPDSSRKVVSAEMVLESFDEMLVSIDEEIKMLASKQVKSVDVKFLRSLKKNLTSLKAKSVRVLKQKRSTRKASSNTNSGFLKPVEISEKMAKFTGWSSSEPRSRVDVTKHICKYIKDNNLQNPQDRREIIPDKTLCKLLDFDPKKDDKPLTYYRIQSYIKPHFIKPVVATA